MRGKGAENAEHMKRPAIRFRQSFSKKWYEVIANRAPGLCFPFLLEVLQQIWYKLDNGNIVNVEIQKIGYGFLGERSACYSSD